MTSHLNGLLIKDSPISPDDLLTLNTSILDSSRVTASGERSE